MDDDDIFNSITGGNTQPTQPVNNVPVSQPVQQKQDDDPFGLLSLNVGGTQPPQNTFTQQSSGFDMGLLGFGNPTPPPQTQPVNNQPANNQSNGGFSLLGDDFLGMGGSQPTQPVNNVSPPQNTGFSFNQPATQNQGFNWGMQQPQQNQANQAQQNPNKFLAYENPQIQIWMNCIK